MKNELKGTMKDKEYFEAARKGCDIIITFLEVSLDKYKRMLREAEKELKIIEKREKRNLQ